MSKVSSKKKKFIKRNFKHLSIEELARQTGLKLQVVRSLVDHYKYELSIKYHSLPSKVISNKGPFTKRSMQLLWIIAILIFLLTLLVYTPTLKNDFVNWDDAQCIYENTHIRSLDFISLKWMIISFHGGNWHPLTWLSHALVYYFWGLNPTMHHLANVIVHACNTLLVFFLVLKILTVSNIPFLIFTSNRGTSSLSQIIIAGSITALLFGLHPLNVESVAWATERKGLLSVFFVLLSLLSYLTYISTIHKQRHLIWLCISLLFFIFSLMSKPIAVTLPVTLLLLDIYPLKRTNLYPNRSLTVFLEKIPFFILSIASGIITIMAQRSSGALVNLQETNLTVRMLNALVTLIFYVEKLIWPSQLIPFYPFNVNLFNIKSVVSGIIILAITGFSLEIARRGKPLWLIAWLFYVITLLPTLSIIQIGSHAAADRFTYLPRLSIFFLFGVGVSWVWMKAHLTNFKELIRGLLLVCVSVVMLLFSYLSIQQIRIWQNSEVLWTYVTSIFPKTASLAHMNLGFVYIEKGRLDEAIAEFKQSLASNPNNAEAYINLGVVYRRKGRLDEAISKYKKALAINPNLAEAYTNLGIAYGQKGLFDEAIAEFKQSLVLKPNYAKGHFNLGTAYSKKGMFDEAIAEYKKALTINPYYVKGYYKLGLDLESKGKLKEAISAYRKTIRLKPDSHEAYNSLAWIYAVSSNAHIRNGAEAVTLATKACELTGFKSAETLNTLAAAYAEQGSFNKAVTYQLRAIDLAPPQIEKELRNRLHLYKSGRAYQNQHD